MKTTYTFEEVAERGKALYEQRIRAQVEPGHRGKLLLIDVESGAWQIGEDRLELARRLRATNPDAILFGLRVGYPVVGKIGAWPLPQGAPTDPTDSLTGPT